MCEICRRMLKGWDTIPFSNLDLRELPSCNAVYAIVSQEAGDFETIREIIRRLIDCPALYHNLIKNYGLRLLYKIPNHPTGILYVGSSRNLRNRISALLFGKKMSKKRTYLVHCRMVDVLFLVIAEFELALAWKPTFTPREDEKKIINEFRKRHGFLPPLNVA